LCGNLNFAGSVDPSPALTTFPSVQDKPVVSLAAARMVYVNTSDNLIVWTLSVPRMPKNATEGISREQLARGFENIQLEAEIDTGTGPAQKPLANALGPGDPISAEAVAALGGGTPLLAVADMPLLRTVTLDTAVRSPTPIPGGLNGDPVPNLDNPGGPSVPPWALNPSPPFAANTAFVRRSYRLSLAVPNTSLGVF